MSEQKEFVDPPMVPKDGAHGYMAKAGDDREVHGFLLEDGGVLWEFHREGHITPIRISQDTMNAMLTVWSVLQYQRVTDDG